MQIEHADGMDNGLEIQPPEFNCRGAGRIDPPDPVEAIKFRMDQQGLTAKDLVPAIGRLNRVYEVLARRRSLTMPMVWRLHQQLGIPAQSLIRPQQRV